MVIIFALFGYNLVLSEREQSEEIARLECELQQAETTDGNKNQSNKSKYKDGKYYGEAKGFDGTIKVKVEIKNRQISDIQIVSADNEDEAYFNMATDIIDRIIAEQSADVDTVSGATFSSTGIKNATEQALRKAINNE